MVVCTWTRQQRESLWIVQTIRLVVLAKAVPPIFISVVGELILQLVVSDRRVGLAINEVYLVTVPEGCGAVVECIFFYIIKCPIA